MFELSKAKKIQSAITEAVGGTVTLDVQAHNHCLIHVEYRGFLVTIDQANGDIVFTVLDDSGAQVQHTQIDHSSSIRKIADTLAELLKEPNVDPVEEPDPCDLIESLRQSSGGQVESKGCDFWWRGESFYLAGTVTGDNIARVSVSGNAAILRIILETLAKKGD